MRIFTGYAKHLLLIRKENELVPMNIATKLGHQVADLFTLNDFQVETAIKFFAGQLAQDLINKRFTPAEASSIIGIRRWLADCDPVSNIFVVVELNSGKALVLNAPVFLTGSV
jgi:hypothetical protein